MKNLSVLCQRLSILPAFFFMGFLQAQEIQTEFAVGYGGAANDYGSGIACDPSGNSYVTGHFFGNITLGDSLYVSAGNQDAYIAKLNPQGEIIWSLAFGGNGADEGKALAVDTEGNCYATGFLGSAGVEIQDETVSSLGGYDVYILKLSPSGELLWVRTFGGASNDQARAIDLSTDGLVHLAGSFQGTMTMGQTVLTSTSAIDAFVCQIDAQGDVTWAGQIAGPNLVESRGLAIDVFGNTYVTGDFLGGSVSAGDLNQTGEGSYDIFLAKYSPGGEVLNLTAFGGIGADGGTSLSTDNVGNVFLGGYFEGSILVDEISVMSNGNRDMLVVKLDENGVAQWAQSVGSTGNDITYALTNDDSGNTYFTGLFFASVSVGDIDLNGGGTFLAKLNPEGNYSWAINFADANSDSGGRGISLDDGNNVALIGNFLGTFDIGASEVPGIEARDVYVVKIEDVILSTSGIQTPSYLSVYPNPGRDYTNIEGLQPGMFCEIFDLHGRKVFQTTAISDRLTLDLTRFLPGVYLIRTSDGSGVNAIRLQVQ
jgi:hypothetical protein